MNNFYDAFISYGRADSKDFATKLQAQLAMSGYKVWFDFRDIPLAVDYQNQIDDGIDHADNFLFIISPHSVNSDYCRKEIDRAIQRNKRIIPLLHVEQISREIWQERYPNGTEAEWQEYQAKGLHSCFPNMHPLISKINWVYGREGIDDFGSAIAKLQEIFERRRDYVRQHTIFLNQALEWERHQQQTRYLLIGEDRIEADIWLKRRFEGEQPPCEPTDLHCEFICESIKNANNLMTQAFLCYAEQESALMEQIRKLLLRQSVTVWTNKTDIQTGEEFQSAIRRGIEQADSLVYLISPAAVQSQYCQQEIEYALSLNKRIIPLLVKPINPEQVSQFGTLQWIDFTDNQVEADYRQDMDKLLKVLQEDTAYYEEHKILLTKALKWERQSRNPSILLRGYNLRSAETWLKTARQRKQHLPTLLQETFITESLRQPPAGSLDTFISYSRADSDFARKLNDTLQLQGKTTWFDQESIASGTDFKQEIYRGIEQSDNIVFILSPSSVNSPYCADEVSYAASLNRRFITILHRPIATDTLHPELAKIQWIDFSQIQNFQDSFNQLIRTLDTDRDYVHNHTKWSQRSLEWQEKDRSEDLLLRGSEFAIAESWLKEAERNSKQPPPTALQKEFIQASSNAISDKARKERRQIAILRALLGLVSAAFVGAVGIGIFAFTQKNLAETALKDQAKTLAQQSLALTGFETNLEFDALMQALRADQLLRQQSLTPEPTTKNQLILALQEALYRIKESSRLIGHEKDVFHLAVSPNGQFIATASADKTVRLWTPEGRFIKVLRHNGEVEDASFSPNSQNLVTWSRDNQVKLWTATGQLIKTLSFNEPIEGKVKGAMFSPDNHSITTWSKKQVQIWTATGELIKTLPLSNGIGGVSISPDGQKFATWREDGTIDLWNDQGKQLATWKQPGTGAILFSPNSQLLATRDNNTVKLWTLKGQELATLSHSRPILAFAFSPNSQILATGGRDRLVRLWRIDGHLLHTLEHNDEVENIRFSADGRTLLTASRDKTAKLWALDEGRELETFQHDGEVYEAAFVPYSALVVTLSGKKTVKVWSLKNPYITLLRGHTALVGRVLFSPNGRMIVTTSWNGTAKLWHRDGTEITTLKGHQERVREVSFSPDSKLIATSSDDKTVKLWSAQGILLQTFQTGAVAKRLSFDRNSQTIAIGIPSETDQDDSTVQLFTVSGYRIKTLAHQWSPVFSPYSPIFATSYNNKVYLWTRTGTLLSTLEGVHRDVIKNVSFSPDGQLVATASADTTVQLWNMKGEPVKTLRGHIDQVGEVKFSPDGKTLLTGGEDTTAKLWNLQGEVLHTLEGHTEKVFQAQFSPDGKLIATAANDQTVKLWNVQGELLQTLNLGGEIYRINFSPDGQQLAIASAQNMGTVWNLDVKALERKQTLSLDWWAGQGCSWISEYLKNQPEESERHLCDGIRPVPAPRPQS